MAVFEFDPRAAALRNEVYLDLGDQRRIVFPIAADLPGEQHAARRFPGENLAPLALRAVLAALIPASADMRLDHHIGNRRGIDRMTAQPPAPHAGGEHREGTLG